MSITYMQMRADRMEDLSRGLFNLMRPPAMRDEHYVSQFYCDWIAHPSDNGWGVLCLPTEETIPLHVAADATLLQEVLAVFVADGAITQQESDGIVAAVGLAAGQQVRVTDFVPPSWQAYALDEAGAIAAGYLEAPEPEPDVPDEPQ